MQRIVGLEDVAHVFIFFLCLTVSTLSPMWGHESFRPLEGEPRALWEAAVKHRAISQQVVPTYAVSRSICQYRDGTPKYREDKYFLFRYTDNGRIKIEVKHAYRDDKNITATEQERVDTGKADYLQFRWDVTPFDPDIQSKIVLGNPLEQIEGGMNLLSYPFQMAVGKNIYRGRARIEVVTGIPFDVVLEPSPLPLFAHYVEIGYRFVEWESRIALSEAFYRYEGSFLFFHEKGEGTISFGGWIILPFVPRMD